MGFFRSGSGLSRSARRGRLSRRLHRKGLGTGAVRARRASRNPAGPHFDGVRRIPRRAPQRATVCLLVRQHRSPPAVRTGLRRQGRVERRRVDVPAFFPIPRKSAAICSTTTSRYSASTGRLRAHRHARARGELDNTIVVVTSDNGMPFPRAKANVYDAGTACRWPSAGRRGSRAGRRSSLRQPYGSGTDLSRSRRPAIASRHDRTQPDASVRKRPRGGGRSRDRVFIERERHANVRRGDLSYPARAIRTAGYLYVHNYRPERWPAGDPEMYFAVGPFGDIDDGPTKQLLMTRRADPANRVFSIWQRRNARWRSCSTWQRIRRN